MRFFFTVALLVHANHGMALECQPVGVTIEFKPLQSSAPVRQDVNAKELTQHARQTGSSERGPHSTVGLYQASSRMEVLAEVVSNSQITCIQKMTLAYSFNHAIQIAREFAPSTCLYRETVVHEREHERIHQDYTLAALQGWANQLTNRALQFNNPKAASDWLATAKNHLNAHVKAVVNPQQEAHDSPQEYEKLGRVCGHEMRYLGLNR